MNNILKIGLGVLVLCGLGFLAYKVMKKDTAGTANGTGGTTGGTGGTGGTTDKCNDANATNNGGAGPCVCKSGYTWDSSQNKCVAPALPQTQNDLVKEELNKFLVKCDNLLAAANSGLASSDLLELKSLANNLLRNPAALTRISNNALTKGLSVRCLAEADIDKAFYAKWKRSVLWRAYWLDKTVQPFATKEKDAGKFSSDCQYGSQLDVAIATLGRGFDGSTSGFTGRFDLETVEMV